MRRACRRWPRAVLVAAATLPFAAALGSCSDSTDDPTAGTGRSTAVYRAVLEWVITQEPAPLDGDELLVFVDDRDEGAVDIDVQGTLIEDLADTAEIRFIDDRAEAVDIDDVGSPVREGGVLVGLGAVPGEGDVVEVYVDRYRHATDVAAWTFTLSRTGEAWTLSPSPAPVDVRPVVEG